MKPLLAGYVGRVWKNGGISNFFLTYNNKAFPLLTSKGQAICFQKLHTKVKRLFEKQTVAPCAFHSVSVRTLSVTNKHSRTQSTHRKARLEPAIRNAQNIFPLLNRNLGGAIQVVANVSPLSPVTVAEFFAKANSDQFRSNFRGKLIPGL